MPPKLQRVIRFDSMPITRAQYTEEGYLVDRPILTSVGIFEYRNPNGTIRRELRLPEEVFDPESLASYRGQPVIITHDAGLIDFTNVGKEQIGTILSEGYKDGEDVRAEIRIYDTNKMKKCGYKELSLGYNLDLDETPGVYKGQKYDAVQRNIRINHLALVENARAGEQARLNIDSRDKTTLIGGKSQMAKKITKRANRADSLLSPEDLKKAIEEYKAKYGAKGGDNAAANDDPVKTSTPPTNTGATATPAPEKKEENTDDDTEETKAPAEGTDFSKNPELIDEKVSEIRDQHTDDEDVNMLCDIIDTLLAKQDFAADSDDAEEDLPVDEMKEDSIDDLNELKGDGDDCEDDTHEDEDDEDETNEDDDEEEEDPFAEHSDEDEDLEDMLKKARTEYTENEDEEDEYADNPTPGDFDLHPGVNENIKQLNTDSIDRIVRERVKVGMVGRKLNMDGLEDLSLTAAKKKIIKAVRPSVRLDGKSAAYINALYDCAVEDVNKRVRKDTRYQKSQMFNRKKTNMDSVDKNSADAARKRMIKRQAENKKR